MSESASAQPTADEILTALRTAPESVLRAIGHLLLPGPPPPMPAPKAGVRVLANGSEVSKTAAAVTVGLPAGQSRFDTLNFLTSTLSVTSATSGRQVDITPLVIGQTLIGFGFSTQAYTP